MKRGIILILMATWLTLSGSWVKAQSLDPDTIDEIARSVVQIIALVDGEAAWVGSGTLVSRDGLIFTNRHVVEGADDLVVALLDNPNELPVPTYRARVDQIFPEDYGTFFLDFATIQIDRDIEGNAILRTRLDLPFLDASKFADARRGEQVFVFGYPTIGDGYFVFTDGLITTVQNDDVAESRIPVWYQTDAEIAPGNSGGLAINGAGQLLGIPTAVNAEERTAARLSGILPFRLIEAAVTNQLVQPEGAGSSTAGTGSTTTPNTTGAGAYVIEITDVQWDGEFNGEPAALVTTRIQAEGYRGVDLRVGVFFYYDDEEEIIPVMAMLDDYATPSGALTSQEVITPEFDNTLWEEFVFPVPLAAFPVETVDRTAVIVADMSVDGEQFNALSEPWNYTVTAAPSTTTGTGTGTFPPGRDIVCSSDLVIEDGVEIIVLQMRPGFEYTATVIGLGDFDPILAVTPTDANSNQAELCSDDDTTAAQYGVALPTTGAVVANGRSSRIRFSHSNNEMMNVSFIVGEFNRNPGEFVLILEGMAVTAADGLGDPFSVVATPNVLASPTPLSLFMIGAERQLDPLTYLINTDTLEPFETSSGLVICDDGGTTSCWGDSFAMSGSQVVRSGNRVINADETDAMLSIPMNTPDGETLNLTYIMTSYEQRSQGQYIIAFHIGVE